MKGIIYSGDDVVRSSSEWLYLQVYKRHPHKGNEKDFMIYRIKFHSRGSANSDEMQNIIQLKVSRKYFVFPEEVGNELILNE